jgi:hypothetical protein
MFLFLIVRNTVDPIVILTRKVTLHLVVKMHSIQKMVLWCIGLMVIISGVSAFTVTGVTITPSGILNPNDPVNVSYTVYAASGTAFPSYDDLQFVSGLDEMVWYYTIIVNDVENVRPVTGGRTLTISGFELSYRNQDEVIVKATLRGRIPQTSVPGATKNLVTIQELDARGYAINSSIFSVNQLIGTPTPTPTPSYGSLSFTSIPSGADIYLDNAYKGFTPLTVNGVSNGNHVVVMRLDSYQDASRTIPVTGNAQTIGITLVPLTTATPTTQPTVTGTAQPVPAGEYGSISITTSPPGARVYVDGEMKGFTPTTIPGISAGKHAILLTSAGYIDVNTTITVTAGTTAEYSSSLVTPAKTPGFGVIAAVISICGLFAIRKIRK